MVINYHTDKFPPQDLDWQRIVPLIGPAQAAIAHYGGILTAVPNANVLMSPLTAQEAVLSSKIEGTQATLGEVLRVEAGDDEPNITPEKRDDIEEILNYRTAMRGAIKDLQTLPLSSQLVCNAHAVLLKGVRGRNSSPGEFRRIQNWIGPKGCTQDRARFIPIQPQLLAEGIDKWNKFLNQDYLDTLVQLAIVHAEFEALHPFLDGNGRIGRLLVPLFLFEKKLLSAPSFYISAFFESNREAYYDQLLNISATGDWTSWCCFFLEALKVQAEENSLKARNILTLYDALKQIVINETHSQHAIPALDFMFQMPIFKSTDLVERTDIPNASAQRILKELKKTPNLLTVLRPASGRRPSILALRGLLNIAEGIEVL
jgi:Fic family protein